MDQPQNKIELSWLFLYKITNEVMTRFSTEDQKIINTCGVKLKNQGMRYLHDAANTSDGNQKAVDVKDKQQEGSGRRT